MARSKFQIGERVEMHCLHVRDGERVLDWVPGQVVQADPRMLAVKFETDVFASNGWLIPDRTLWCTHGSRNLRRPDENASKEDNHAESHGLRSS